MMQVLPSTFGRALACVCLSVAVATTGIAQNAPSKVATNALTRLPSDTGRMLRGNTDFSGYVTPGMCHTAVWSMTNRLRRSEGRDTAAAAAIYSDSLSPVAIAAGKKCLANFAVATVTPVELRNFELLALLTGNDTLARSAGARRLALATSLGDSALILQETVVNLLAIQPARLTAARVALDQLERLGSPAGVQILIAQTRLLAVLRDRFDVAQIKGLTTSMLSVANMLSIADRDRMAPSIKTAWLAKREIAYWESPDSVPGTLARMDQELSLLNNGRGVNGMFDMDRIRFDELVLPQLSRPLKNLSGTPRYVFPASPSMELQAGQLPRGVTHLVFVSNPSLPLMIHGMVRRIHEKYGAKGLQVTFALGTLGFTSWNQSSVYTPAQEAESIRELLFDRLRLPVSLVLEELSVSHKPDGRKILGEMQWYSRTPTLMLLIDREGVLRMALPAFTSEAMLDAYVGRLVGSELARDRGSQDAK